MMHTPQLRGFREGSRLRVFQGARKVGEPGRGGLVVTRGLEPLKTTPEQPGKRPGGVTGKGKSMEQVKNEWR